MLSPSRSPPPPPYQVLLPTFPLLGVSPGGTVCASLPSWSFLGFGNKGKESKMLLENGGKGFFYWGKEIGVEGCVRLHPCPLSPPPSWPTLDLYLEGW